MSQCFLPIFPSSALSEYWIIGNHFLDTTYTVFDMEPNNQGRKDYIQISLGQLDVNNKALIQEQSYSTIPNQESLLTAFILSFIFGTFILIGCFCYCMSMCVKRRSFFKKENETLAILRQLGEENSKNQIE